MALNGFHTSHVDQLAAEGIRSIDIKDVDECDFIDQRQGWSWWLEGRHVHRHRAGSPLLANDKAISFEKIRETRIMNSRTIRLIGKMAKRIVRDILPVKCPASEFPLVLLISGHRVTNDSTATRMNLGRTGLIALPLNDPFHVE